MGTAPEAVKRLIDRFNQQADQVRAPDYNETQLRIDFINPLFAQLGWDMDNAQGFAEQYREVVHEDRVKVAGTTKAPDYSFRIGGVRKFFLEAKKPFVNIKEAWEPAYQLRRYAWSAKLAVSLLTDFEEFAIYDCRVAPKQMDKPSTARREYIIYTEYAERWDFLDGTFSKRAVLTGEFDRYCATKKGHGAQEFDEAFLVEIEEWRKKLATNLALRNDVSEHDLNFATQRIIDRIIFLRICEDRGVEPTGHLQQLLNGESTYRRLVTLFREADTRYNSGLFHFKRESGREEMPDELTVTLEVDDAALKSILRRLYYPESPYEFTVVSADILGSVYERFLGKVIERRGEHSVKIVEKPEVRKAGGVYYTPTYIVDHIVRQTVGNLIEGRTPKEVAQLKVLDPACGSGSFLLGAYQHLLDWHLKWYVSDGPQKYSKGKGAKVRPADKPTFTAESAGASPDPANRALGHWALTTAERKRILLDNIHGVDIDYQAVEVTKLSLLLRCLEGETAESLRGFVTLFRERALPDLGRNIQCGNSLIGTDITQTDPWRRMREDERKRINPFDYDRAFPQVFGRNGFDAVIGNPPYINMLTLDKLQPRAVKDYWKERYSTAAGAFDIYILFIEQGQRMLRASGRLGFIVPNKFLAAEYAIEFRSWVLRTWEIESLVDYSRVNVWKQAAVYPVVPVFRNIPPKKTDALTVLRAIDASSAKFEEPIRVSVKQLTEMPDNLWSFVTRRGAATLLRIIRNSRPLEEIAEVFGATTVAEGDHYPKLILEPSRQLAKPGFAKFVVSGAVDRYSTSWASEPIQFTRKHYRRPLIALKPPMPQRRIDQATSSKIIICKVALRPRAMFDEGGEYVGAYTTYVLNSRLPLKYLTAIINSSLMYWAYQLLYDALAMGGGYLRFQPPQVRRIPIKVPSSESDKRYEHQIISLADEMASLHNAAVAAKAPQEKEQLQRRIEATDRRIDQIVYELYGLTDAEIRLVEESIATPSNP